MMNGPISFVDSYITSDNSRWQPPNIPTVLSMTIIFFYSIRTKEEEGEERHNKILSPTNFGETSERKIELQSIDRANYNCYPLVTFSLDSFLRMPCLSVELDLIWLNFYAIIKLIIKPIIYASETSFDDMREKSWEGYLDHALIEKY